MDTQSLEFIKQKNAEAPIVMYTKTWCPYSDLCKQYLTQHNARFVAIDVDVIERGFEIEKALLQMTDRNVVPVIYFNQELFGGVNELNAREKRGVLAKLVKEVHFKFDNPGAEVLNTK